MRLWVTTTFEAAHSLPSELGYPTIHGHSYWVRAWFFSPPDDPLPLGTAQAYIDMNVRTLDHQMLNDKIEVPTMEAICQYLIEHWEGKKPVRLSVWRESIGTGAEWGI